MFVAGSERDFRLYPCVVQAFVLVFCLMLVGVITIADYLVGHHLNSRLPFHIPESGVTMFLGMLLGGMITLGGNARRAVHTEWCICCSQCLLVFNQVPT